MAEILPVSGEDVTPKGDFRPNKRGRVSIYEIETGRKADVIVSIDNVLTVI